MNKAVDLSLTLHRLTSRDLAPACLKPRVRPCIPSKLYAPRAVSQAESVTSRVFLRSRVATSAAAVRENASEKRLREMCAKSPDVLHLATHGFFISSETDAMRVPFMRRYSSQIGSPMQRSGVALANAEATWKGSATPPEDSDGILTAAEVATLDLRKTRLVTLSACETALVEWGGILLSHFVNSLPVRSMAIAATEPVAVESRHE